MRAAAINSRTDVPIDLKVPEMHFLRTARVAVRVNGGWAFFDPGAAWQPFGMLAWDCEGTTAIIAGPDDGLVATTPLSDASASQRSSVGDLELSEEGTLSGNLRIELTGHLAADQRAQESGTSPIACQEAWEENLAAAFGAAAITKPRMESHLASDSPYVFTCRIRVPGYAQRTGKRLIFQPAVFRRSATPVFPASERRTPIAFHYSWAERDTVRIRLPQGFVPEAFSPASPVVIRDVARHELRVTVSMDGHTLNAVRGFTFGENGMLSFPVESYASLKGAFDLMREHDAQTLVLAQAGAR